MLILQTPLPPVDPNIIIHALVPIVGMATGIIISGFLLLGPVGRAVGQVLKHWLGGGSREQTGLQSGDLDEVMGRLDTIQHHLTELNERQDFAERVLAQARKDRGLIGGGDVPL
ncbi:MAG TPA: hypothetical protein VGI92_04410 [Gemmatimonadales bacterium]